MMMKTKCHTHTVHSAKPLACTENANGCQFCADEFHNLGNHVQEFIKRFIQKILYVADVTNLSLDKVISEHL